MSFFKTVQKASTLFTLFTPQIMPKMPITVYMLWWWYITKRRHKESKGRVTSWWHCQPVKQAKMFLSFKVLKLQSEFDSWARTAVSMMSVRRPSTHRWASCFTAALSVSQPSLLCRRQSCNSLDCPVPPRFAHPSSPWWWSSLLPPVRR